MSILVRGMEMPEGCLAFDPEKACPCFNSEYGECAVMRREPKHGAGGRPDWCPLVEVEEFEVWPNLDKKRAFNILKTKGGMHFMGPNGPVDAPKGDNV